MKRKQIDDLEAMFRQYAETLDTERGLWEVGSEQFLAWLRDSCTSSNDDAVAASAFLTSLLVRADDYSPRSNVPLWHGWALIEAFLAGAAFARSDVRGLLIDCQSTLEMVLFDEATIEAGLWRGPAIPRRLRQIKEMLDRLGDGKNATT